jgi:hypothetical protein
MIIRCSVLWFGGCKQKTTSGDAVFCKRLTVPGIAGGLKQPISNALREYFRFHIQHTLS